MKMPKKLNKKIAKEVKKDVKKALTGKNKKPVAHPQPRKPASGQVSRGISVQLSGCVLEYAKLVGNPFGINSSACLPADAAMTQPCGVLSTWIKGTGATSTGGASPTGFGFVGFRPFYMAFNNNTGNGVPIAVSGTLFQGTASTVTNPTTGVTFTNSNSPYTISATQQFRLICAGLRVRYRGTQLNKGGSIYPLISRDHISISSGGIGSVSGCQADPKVHAVPMSSNWVEIVSVPSEEEEMQFHTYGGSGGPNWNADCMAFLLQGVDSSTACSFEYEAFCHFEVIGDGVTYRQSYADPLGAAAVLNAIKRRGSSPVYHDTKWDLVREITQEVAGFSGPVKH